MKIEAKKQRRVESIKLQTMNKIIDIYNKPYVLSDPYDYRPSYEIRDKQIELIISSMLSEIKEN